MAKLNDIAVQDFIKAIREEPVDTNKTYNATVSRVDNEGVVWVNLYGSDKETPTSSVSSEVKRGDNVNVNWRNNKLYIEGNYSNPSAGVVRVEKVEETAKTALSDAEKAHIAADVAWKEAERAHEAADQAENYAEIAHTQAEDATTAASGAQYSLSEVERVVDVLNWIAEHGDYAVTDDTEVVVGKFYFELVDGSYVNVTPDEDADPHALGLYELVSVDESISNYVASHVSLDDDGLVIQTDGVKTKVRISGAGVLLTNEIGNTIATFSESIILGDITGMHVTLSPGDDSQTPAVLPELGFWQGTEKVAYINSETLFIEQARINKTLYIGKFMWRVQGDRISLVYAPE